MAADKIIENSFKNDWGPSIAYMLRLTSDLTMAEECVQAAFEAAVKTWGKSAPDNKGAWIRKAARNRFIDTTRASKTHHAAQSALTHAHETENPHIDDENSILDDQLTLMFLCCHPAISPTDQVILVLRLIGGLKPYEIATAFLGKEDAIRSRLLRTKRKMQVAKISTKMPEGADLSTRVEQVLAAIYLIYNEGYRASRNAAQQKVNLVLEAIRFAAAFCKFMPNNPEAHGLMALILLSEARRPARFINARLVALEEQDRALWDRDLIKAGLFHIAKSNALTNTLANTHNRGAGGVYTLQAKISSIHCNTASFEMTDWQKITGFYDHLLDISQTPVLQLNRLAAVSYLQEKDLSLDELAQWEHRNDCTVQSLSLRADIHRRFGDHELARKNYQSAINLEVDEDIKTFLKSRRDNLGHAIN